MLFQTNVVLEEPITCVAVVVLVQVVGLQVLVVFKMGVAFATVMMYGALDVVLFEAPRRVEVRFTIITDVVTGRV